MEEKPKKDTRKGAKQTRDPKAFSVKRFKYLKKFWNINNEVVAADTGLSLSTVKNATKTGLSPYSLDRIAKYFFVSVDYLSGKEQKHFPYDEYLKNNDPDKVKRYFDYLVQERIIDNEGYYIPPYDGVPPSYSSFRDSLKKTIDSYFDWISIERPFGIEKQAEINLFKFEHQEEIEKKIYSILTGYNVEYAKEHKDRLVSEGLIAPTDTLLGVENEQKEK